MLCACTLRGMGDSFLLKTMENDGFEETIVDRSMDWLHFQARAAVVLRPERVLATGVAFHHQVNGEALIASLARPLTSLPLVALSVQRDEYPGFGIMYERLMTEAEDVISAWETRHVRQSLRQRHALPSVADTLHSFGTSAFWRRC